MVTEVDDKTLSSDDAFAALGNETRMAILQELGDSDEPISYSGLLDAVGLHDSGRFNYHLDKLVGHFVEHTGQGYVLRQSGRRVIEAVLSGAVTDSPVIERTRIDRACHYCGAPSIEMSYREEQVGTFCTQCHGTYGGSIDASGADLPADQERLGYLHLPPAGVQGRTPKEVLLASLVWFLGETVTTARGVCPRCSAAVDTTLSVCDPHETADGLCDRCGRRYAVVVRHRCTNCIYGIEGAIPTQLVANLELRAFLIEHGIDPIAPTSERYFEATFVYDEEVLSTEPFGARYEFTINGDVLTLTVDDELNVVEVATSESTEPS